MTSTNPSLTYAQVMEETHELNPYVIMRKDANLTQAGLAEILDLSEQVVRKLEYGLFAGPNRTVTRELIDTLPNNYHANIVSAMTNLNLSEEQWVNVLEIADKNTTTTKERMKLVEVWYHAWQTFRRKAVGQLLKDAGFYMPPKVVTTTQFYRWIMVHLVAEDEEITVFEFCKALSLHPYTVQRWLGRDTRGFDVPPSLVEPLTTVLAEVDIKLEDVVFARGRG